MLYFSEPFADSGLDTSLVRAHFSMATTPMLVEDWPEHCLPCQFKVFLHRGFKLFDQPRWVSSVRQGKSLLGLCEPIANWYLNKQSWMLQEVFRYLSPCIVWTDLPVSWPQKQNVSVFLWCRKFQANSRSGRDKEKGLRISPSETSLGSESTFLLPMFTRVRSPAWSNSQQMTLALSLCTAEQDKH